MTQKKATRTTKAAVKAVDDESYQQLRAKLDGLVLRLQDPDCDIDEAAATYQQALQLVGRLEAHLEQAENHIRKVQADFGVATDAGGAAV